MQQFGTWPIYVPSKGRWDTIRVADTLIPFVTVFVEAPELEQYRKHHPELEYHVIAEVDRGLGYVRNYIKNYATRMGLNWYWMLDDDISAYYRVEGGRCVKHDALEVLQGAQDVIHASEVKLGIAQAALEYQQFAWRTTRKVVMDSYCDVCVAVNTKRTILTWYREVLRFKQDRDFTLQVLASGWHTMRVGGYAFAAPKNGSNAGGLHDLYKTRGVEASFAEKLMELWPGVVTIQVKSDGRIDAKIDWSSFKKARNFVTDKNERKKRLAHTRANYDPHAPRPGGKANI